MWISGSGGSGIVGKGRSRMDMGSNFDRKGFGLDLERARLVGFGYVWKGEFGGSEENLWFEEGKG